MKINPFALAVLAALAAAATLSGAAAKPNVLFIAVDDLRTSLGAYGDPLALTPNLDRLARESRLFERAYTMQAVCGPARTAILTGRLPDHNRTWHNRNLFRATNPDTVTLPQLFKQHGYHTQAMGKIFSGDARELDPASWSVPEILRKDGWKNYALPRGAGPGKQAPYEAADVPDDGYDDGKLANLAVETLGKLKTRAEPFFLAVGFFKPHLPFNAPKKYWDLHDPKKFDLPGEPEGVREAPAAAYHTHRELGGYAGVAKDERLDAEQTRLLRHGYYACVSYVDAQVGRVITALDRLGLADDTVIVFTSDHGYHMGEHGLWQKRSLFEESARVPLVIAAPGGRAGVADGHTVELIDLAPDDRVRRREHVRTDRERQVAAPLRPDAATNAVGRFEDQWIAIAQLARRRHAGDTAANDHYIAFLDHAAILTNATRPSTATTGRARRDRVPPQRLRRPRSGLRTA